MCVQVYYLDYTEFNMTIGWLFIAYFETIFNQKDSQLLNLWIYMLNFNTFTFFMRVE